VLTTFILVTFGCASIAQYKLLRKDNQTNTNFLAINVSWAFAVTLGAIVGGKISGAHMNPAVSLAMLITGRLSLIRFLIYIVAQFIGAFLGAAVVFLVYLDGIQSAGGTDSMDMAGIFATYPSGYLTSFGGFFDQVVGTAMLLLVVLTVSDKRNSDLPQGVVAILLGFTILLIGTCFGANCGYAVNPARDFAPRVFTAIAGWGSRPFSQGSYFFWIPIVGPFTGSIIATFLYLILVENNWP
jgi:aquaporin-3